MGLQQRIWQDLIEQTCGGENKLSHFIMRCIGMRTNEEIFGELGDLTEEFAMNKENDLKRDVKDENIKLFGDYIKEYTAGSDAKYAKKQLFGDMTAMFMAATDTTYSALGFCLLMAAKYPLIQKELFNELNTAFDGNIDNITLADGTITKIPKLRAFIHEVLRIYPPAMAAGFREMKHDNFKMDTGDKVYNVPKGTVLMMNIMMVHHTPKYWIKDFDPKNKKHTGMDMKQIHFDFWLDSDGNFKKNAVSLLTFGSGRRDCVGQALAMKELYIVLAMTFMKYEVFGPNGDEQFDIGTNLQVIMEPSPDAINLKQR